MGLGFTLALVVIGSIRELIGNGTVFGATILSSSFYQPALLAILAPGGFITLGILMGLFRNRQIKKEEREKGGAPSSYDGWEQLSACSGCALKNICGGGDSSVVCAKEAAPAISSPQKEAGK